MRDAPISAGPPPPDRPELITRRSLLRLGLSIPPMFLLAACGGTQIAAPTATSKPAAAPTSPAPTAAPAVVPVASPATTAAPPAQAGGAPGVLPSCMVRPQQTEGPYWVDERLNRSDIRSDPSDGTVKDGVPLRLVFRVSQVAGNACTPLVGAQVDVWHCDALGVYSDAQDPGFNTSGKKFLRGYQFTDSSGQAQFTTIYPGWYQGRAVHIHFKVRTDPASERGQEFTSQLYFDDALTDQVHVRQPYASKGPRTSRERNSGDNIFQRGGDQLLLQLTPEGEGYAGTFDIGLQMS